MVDDMIADIGSDTPDEESSGVIVAPVSFTGGGSIFE
jgi:hypothetical protein